MEEEKIERKIAAIEVYKYLKVIRWVTTLAIFGFFFSPLAIKVTRFWYVLPFAFCCPMLYFLYMSTKEIQYLEKKYNLVPKNDKPNIPNTE